MFSSLRRQFILALAAGLVAQGCGSPAAKSVERLAVPPAENLSGQSSLDWVGFAISEIVVEKLAGAPLVNASRVDSPRDAASFRATRVLHSYYDVRDSRLSLHVAIENLGTNKMVDTFEIVGTLPDGVLAIAGELAARTGPVVRDFGTRDAAAIRAYGQSLAARGGPEREANLRRAVAADPSFTFAAVALAEMLLSSGRSAEAGELLATARSAPHPDAIDRARIDVLFASAQGNRAALAEGLAEYARARPADSDAAERAANASLRLHRYREAADWYRAAALLEPERAEFWNLSAYPLAYAGDFNGAVTSLERYRQLRPDSANVDDSFGEIHSRFGRYEAAQQYFLQAHEKEPEFQGGIALVKAARTLLMRGQLDEADRLFQRYIEFRREVDDPLIDLYAAQWNYWTGRENRAIESLTGILRQASASPAQGAAAPALVVAAAGRLGYWALLSGDRQSAAGFLDEALRATQGRITDGLLLAVKFLSQPAAGPDEWQRRAEQLFPEPANARLERELLLSAHLLAAEFDRALPILERLAGDSTPFSQDELQVLRGWALIEKGKFDEARELLRYDPVVQPRNESLLYALGFPRIFYLRGLLAERAGETATAVSNLRLYLNYAGDTPSSQSEKQKARQLLAKLGEP